MTDSSSHKNRDLPDWLLREWRDIHDLEPALYPSAELLNSNSRYCTDLDLRTAALARETTRLYGDNVSHVFLAPWLVTGGSDRLTINYITALAGEGLSRAIVLVTTLNRESPWARKLPSGVRFIEFGKQFSFLSPEKQTDLLASMLLRWSPEVIHTINSDLGFRIVAKHGQELSRASRLYASSFCMDISPEGYRVGYPAEHLPRCIDYLTGVISENQRHLDELADIYAYDPRKLYLHYQPVDTPGIRPDHAPAKDRAAGRDDLRILWAGRFDRQKRPDLLVRIVRESGNLPFRFFVYGVPILEDDTHYLQLSGLNNVSFGGSFDTLDSLPLEEFDLLLYTAGWDGMPNILLEAAAARLPVVAADAGGIRELITDGHSGFLVTPLDDIGSYLEKLMAIHADRSLLPGFAENAFQRVRAQHSREGFIQGLQAIPGYTCKGSAPADA